MSSVNNSRSGTGADARPATLVDNWLIFSDGSVRKLTISERLRERLGLLKTVKVKGAVHDTI